MASSKEDKSEAFKWFIKSAYNRYYPALYQIALMQRDGIGTAKNYEKMKNTLKTASDMGHIPSTILLADLCLQGKIIPKNEPLAFELYLRGAKSGNGKCQYQVATIYKEGIGTNKNSDESDKWFKRFSNVSNSLNNLWIANWAKLNGYQDHTLINELYSRSANGGNSTSLSNVICTYILETIKIMKNKCAIWKIWHQAEISMP